MSLSSLNSAVMSSTERDEVGQVVHGTAFSQRGDVMNGQVPLRVTTLTVLDGGAAVPIPCLGRVSSLAPGRSVPDFVLWPAVPLPLPRFEAGGTAPTLQLRRRKDPLTLLANPLDRHYLFARQSATLTVSQPSHTPAAIPPRNHVVGIYFFAALSA
jgi:hypothetical protein